MAGSPTFTIVLSRPTMNRLMQQTASMRARRPPVRRPPVSAPGSVSAPGASSSPSTGTGVRSGSRTGTLSDLQSAALAGACIVQTPRVVLAADEYCYLGHVWREAVVRALYRGTRPDD